VSRLRRERREKAAMTAMPWDSFLDDHPRSHLVVAWLHARHRSGPARSVRLDLLKTMATVLDPRGDWSCANPNEEEIYISYANAADAAQLCTLVRARPLGSSLQWLSQSAFHFDSAAQKLIMDALKREAGPVAPS
jgi:hypothetical protein